MFIFFFLLNIFIKLIGFYINETFESFHLVFYHIREERVKNSVTETMVNYYISQMILFPFYDINLDLGKGKLQRCRLGHLSCMEDVSAIKDTQFQLRWFLLFALGCDCVARSFCAALPTPPGQYLLQTLQSSHLPPFVREVQLFFFGKLRGVFNTQPHSLVWFDFSLLCILFLINPVLQNEISVRTWE